ncbi:hypothetical protein M1116_01765 [Patescibacteria group bacterium]|nr:hypothetical protein [Patescibacteria group bacterium]
MTKRIAFPLFLVVIILVGLNLYLKKTDPLYSLRRQLISLSRGDRYQGYLSLYRYYLENNNLPSARLIAAKLDPGDIKTLETDYYPEVIARAINELIYKNNKTPDDWVEIARLQAKIGLNKEAKESLKTAHLLDPVRDDLETLYMQFP